MIIFSLFFFIFPFMHMHTSNHVLAYNFSRVYLMCLLIYFLFQILNHLPGSINKSFNHIIMMFLMPMLCYPLHVIMKPQNLINFYKL
ncbi:hypothetical protein RhiirA5_115043 [Rhizophagus irregularis]|uniref:Uncharacterized protein n=3 Tax=Rhizophagus irregularis TaxID=588596 RepID=A0A2N0PXR8_9GLOM|nr:hypothetical protein RhiirA5_115043 [Rhizophagus irregularis]GET65462.1 hypothetical protein RIR_jg25787.t1 [Rhizophagus irregularis DAOM 181602=DAOM 197198]